MLSSWDSIPESSIAAPTIVGALIGPDGFMGSTPNLVEFLLQCIVCLVPFQREKVAVAAEADDSAFMPSYKPSPRLGYVELALEWKDESFDDFRRRVSRVVNECDGVAGMIDFKRAFNIQSECVWDNNVAVCRNAN